MDFLLGRNKVGSIAVVFSDIKDILKETKKTKDGRNIEVLSFTEDGVEFCYILTPKGYYKDVYENGPEFKSYEITQDQQKVKAIVDAFGDKADEEDEDDDWFDQLARANANYTRSGGSSNHDYGCGSGRSSYGGACGGSSSYSYGGCGGSGHYGC
jgi:hypothetical protein